MAVTLDEYGPFNTGLGANTMAEQWRKIVRHVRDSGVIATKTDPDPPDELQVFGDSTGMQVKVKPGQAWVRGHWCELATQSTLPIAASHGSLGRLDLVVVQADLAAETMAVVVKTGTPSASPELPELVNDDSYLEIPLAQVVVDAGASTITAAKVVDERKRAGTGVFNTWEPPLYYEGAPGSLGQNNVNLGSGSLKQCKWFQMGNVLFLHYLFDWGTAPYNGGSGRIYTKLPPGFVSADHGDHRLVSHLWTHTPADNDWMGTSLIRAGENNVFPFFSRAIGDNRLSWYTIDAYPGVGPGSGVPSISGGYPEGGHLTISGMVEVVNTGIQAEIPSGGGGTEVERFTTEWSATWGATWDSFGKNSNPDLYQGRHSSGAGGYEYSKIGFDYANIQSTLTGATIISVELWLGNNHAYYSSGLNAMIGTHSNTTEPAGSSSTTSATFDRLRRYYGRYESKWVTLTTGIGDEFKAGTTRGITLGHPSSGGLNEYGYFERDGGNRPRLRITYDKAV